MRIVSILAAAVFTFVVTAALAEPLADLWSPPAEAHRLAPGS